MIQYVTQQQNKNGIAIGSNYLFSTKHGICLSPHVLLVGSEVCTADKPSWKHACVCCVHHLEYNAKHCSVWIFLVALFGKSSCKRTKEQKESAWALIEGSAFPCLLMHFM